LYSNADCPAVDLKRDLELLGVGGNVVLDRGRWREIITSQTLLKEIILTLNENDDYDDIYIL